MAALTAGLFVAYLIVLSPHWVHHLLDDDRDQPACPLFAQSQQTPEVQTDPPALTPPSHGEVVHAVLASAVPPVAALTASHPRAPPRSAPSA